jgi:hypothetical protein
MRFVNIDTIIKNKNISEDLIIKILNTLKLKETSINYELMCTDKDSLLVLDDITIYDDLLNSTFDDHKTNIYILKENNKTKLHCFKSHFDKIQIRSLKQKLSDISTGYIIKQFNDKNFKEFFRYFYITIDTLLASYGKYKNLRIPEDICLFYKGGNIFRMLLHDISKLIESEEYISLLKRSDADFQLFINPELKDYNNIFQEISILVIYSLMLFKVKKSNLIFDFIKLKDDLLLLYKEELENTLGSIKTIEFVDNNTKKDFSIEPSVYNKENIVIYKEYTSLLENIPKIKKNNEFFISRNTSLNFTRKDNLKSVFDLIRMKRNIRIKYILESDNTPHIISVPCEIIDVSIPKGDDYGLMTIKNKMNKYIRLYKLNDTLTFWAPNINYMIKDLDDVLFKQSEYPWSDLKIDKRLIRYFLSLLFHYIITNTESDIVLTLNKFKQDLKELLLFIECYNAKNSCEDNTSRLFYIKYKKISKKINSIKDKEEKLRELGKFNIFNKKLIIILKNLIKEIDNLIINLDKVTKLKLLKIYKNLVIDHKIVALG